MVGSHVHEMVRVCRLVIASQQVLLDSRGGTSVPDEGIYLRRCIVCRHGFVPGMVFCISRPAINIVSRITKPEDLGVVSK